MPSLADVISYTKPSQSMEVSLGLLAALFNAKVDGGIDTDAAKDMEIEPTVPINAGIQDMMKLITTNSKFKYLEDLGGPFMEKWKELEGTMKNWDNQEFKPDKKWIFKLIAAYYDDLRLIRGRLGD